MTEYIKREAILEELNNYIEQYVAQNQNARARAISDFGRFIREFPAADVVVQKRGKWFVNDNGTVYCSRCKEEALLTLDAIEDITFKESNFCPNCGAKME